MEKPALAARIADFLKLYPPFSYLPESDLLRLSLLVTVRYVPSQTVIFTQGQEPLEDFFIVRKGALRLFRNDDSVRLVDQLDEGDVFGIRPLIAKQRYAVTARSSEETLLYAIPLDRFEQLIDKHPSVARFLAQSFAAGVRNPLKPEGQGRVMIESEAALASQIVGSDRREQLIDLTRVSVTRSPVTCLPGDTIQQVAQRMSQEGVGSMVVVDEEGLPLGILTDRDLRNKVVTGLYAASDPVTEIMSSPTITIAPDQKSVEVQLLMVRNRISHLVVTEDGSTQKPVLGVISNRDLLLALGNSPAAIISEIEQARDVVELSALRSRAEQWLRPIVDQRGSVYAASKIMTEVNDHISRRCIEMAMETLKEEGVESPELAFCWLGLGSQGRGEQLLRTDQDHAIVIANGEESKLQEAKAYYALLGDRVSWLLAQIGYDRCVGDMMASNPEWCLSLEEWQDHLHTWVKTPSGENLLNASTLLDRRPVYGDFELGKTLLQHSAQVVKSESLFLAFLAKAALDNPPPLSFFRNFVVESSGEHKDDFDIKQRAMLPLVDAARVLSYSLGVPDSPHTIDRYDRLRQLEPQNAEVYHAAAQAYDTLMLFRARQGFSDGGDGRYFRIRDLSKLERLQLRNTFRPIDDLLAILKMRFQLQLLPQ